MTEVERTKFLHHLVQGTRDVLRAQTGLAEHENYHEFCRLLGRLKHNYQLSELVGHLLCYGAIFLNTHARSLVSLTNMAFEPLLRGNIQAGGQKKNANVQTKWQC